MPMFNRKNGDTKAARLDHMINICAFHMARAIVPKPHPRLERRAQRADRWMGKFMEARFGK